MIGTDRTQAGFPATLSGNANRVFAPTRVNDLAPIGGGPLPEVQSAGSALGEGDRIVKASDGFLSLLGYSLNDLWEGSLAWQQLAPPQVSDSTSCRPVNPDASLLQIAPYSRELIRKDGTRMWAEIAAFILDTVPFRWFVAVRPLPPLEPKEVETLPIPQVTPGFERFVGSCPAIRNVMALVARVAPTDSTVLILGETGTGKELVARAIHDLSQRRKAPFVTLNCAAIPAGILESELFGHERGAFTGAQGQRSGRFELANGGTLFLDEVGDLPVELQPKLLRVLQERTIERLGGSKSININVRIIAATNRDLPAMVAAKSFRSELFYRLNVFPITTPPLRVRGADISLLVNHFTRVYAAKMGKDIDRIPLATMRALSAWPWPGNVRELENFIERSVILSSQDFLEAPLNDLDEEAGVSAPLPETLDRMIRSHVVAALKECNGVITQAAKRLGMCRTTLNGLMIRFQIHRRDFC